MNQSENNHNSVRSSNLHLHQHTSFDRAVILSHYSLHS